MSQERIPKFSVGDEVKLKIGGPVMVIQTILKDLKYKKFIGSYRCQWFVGKKFEKATFAEENLQFIPDENSPLE